MLPLVGRQNVDVSRGRFNPIQCPFNIVVSRVLFPFYIESSCSFVDTLLDCLCKGTEEHVYFSVFISGLLIDLLKHDRAGVLTTKKPFGLLVSILHSQ